MMIQSVNHKFLWWFIVNQTSYIYSTLRLGLWIHDSWIIPMHNLSSVFNWLLLGKEYLIPGVLDESDQVTPSHFAVDLPELGVWVIDSLYTTSMLLCDWYMVRYIAESSCSDTQRTFSWLSFGFDFWFDSVDIDSMIQFIHSIDTGLMNYESWYFVGLIQFDSMWCRHDY